eukprot:CAMPEP_0179977424 /NCGR_PEP_ID=MMETSP0983-20121128/40071_1 /TAXON_ID=483367 /ORGANISM="non described non described, Strain CCMP 2436" /LENGTH=223 /DNA_ID=CAMNT_0021894649 /DNA_START=208 /DNA_END=877 /DNA_ORIENTATION=-
MDRVSELHEAMILRSFGYSVDSERHVDDLTKGLENLSNLFRSGPEWEAVYESLSRSRKRFLVIALALDINVRRRARAPAAGRQSSSCGSERGNGLANILFTDLRRDVPTCAVTRLPKCTVSCKRLNKREASAASVNVTNPKVLGFPVITSSTISLRSGARSASSAGLTFGKLFTLIEMSSPAPPPPPPAAAAACSLFVAKASAPKLSGTREAGVAELPGCDSS